MKRLTELDQDYVEPECLLRETIEQNDLFWSYKRCNSFFKFISRCFNHIGRGIKTKKERRIMKKGLVVVLALVAIGTLGIFADGGKEAAAADGKTIKVGVNSENPPWIFSKDGKMTGFEADIVEEFAKRAGYKLDYKSAPFSTVLTGVQSGQWDVAMSSIWIKKERAEVMDFADPYYDSGIGMMTQE